MNLYLNEIDLVMASALGWLCCLLSSFYIQRCVRVGVKVRRPFGCAKCLGFWVGLLYSILHLQGIYEIGIFACATSLIASILNGITKRLNAGI